MFKTESPEQLGFNPTRLNRINAMMDRYVTDGRTAGMLSLVSRRGKIVHAATCGYSDIATKTPIQHDTIFRIYSMTKPITTVALMSLLEQGEFHLDDEAHHWIPALKNLQVYSANGKLVDLQSYITIRQLLTHTAGFSYGFYPDDHPVDKMYQEIWQALKPSITLAEMVDLILALPLVAQPGTRWHYSIATDICGYLVEMISGQTFAEYLQQHIFDPLDMNDTAFEVPTEKWGRFATLYGWTPNDPLAVIEDTSASPYATPVKMHSGGGGLVSTAMDYWRFSQMMLNGGVLNGVRIIGRKTVERITTNHLPATLLPLHFNGIVPQPMSGYGFGLGYCVNIDPASTGTLGSFGDYGWGGMADTYCWIDPQEELIGLLMQQYQPSLTHAGRRDFRNSVYQALN